MALKRGQELSRGVRRTQLENSFGVVKTASASLGEIGGRLAETAEKITLFQADVMDKEWQNNFDSQTSLFITEETNKELNSANPDIVGLQQKLLTYKDKTLQEAPQRFQNYITNKLDVRFAEGINLVKDYSNKLKFNNLYTETTQLGTQLINSTSNYLDQVIKNNPGDLEYVNELMENHFLNVVTPEINRYAKNFEILNKLKPLKVTEADVQANVRALQIDFVGEKLTAQMKSIISAIDLENNTGEENSLALMKANETIDSLIEEFVTNPESRDISNLSDTEVEGIRSKYEAEKKRLLSFHSEKVAQANIVTDLIASNQSTAIINSFKNNPSLSLQTNLGGIVELATSDPYVGRNQTLILDTVEKSMKAVTIHQTMNNIRNEFNGTFPESLTLKNIVNNRTGYDLTEEEINEYVFKSFGASSLTVIDYMKIVNDMENNPSYGANLDGVKNENQVEIEKNNINQRAVFEYNLEHGFLPNDAKNVYSQVEAILTKDQIGDTDLVQINDAFKFYRITKGKLGDKLYEQRLGPISDFFEYLDDTRGDVFADVVTTDIGSLRSMINEYREFLQKPFDREQAYEFLKDEELDYLTTETLGQKVVDDISSQFGFKSLGNWIRNQIPDFMPGGLAEEDKKVKTNSYTDLFNISGTKKIVLGLLSPITPENLENKIISLDPIVESQLQNQYMIELNKLVDFSLQGKDDGKLKQDILKNQEKALDRAVRFLRDNNFGVSKYERMGAGYTLTYDPLENKIPYESSEDKDLYIAVHFYNRVKDMENKYDEKEMMRLYPDFYFANYGTDQENKVEFDLGRAYELAIDQDGVYFTREPGTNVYRYNLDPAVFGSSRNELDGDTDDDQFFRPDDVLVINGQLISSESVVGNAIDKYLDEQPYLDIFEGIGISETMYRNFLYTTFYPGVKFMTSEEEIVDYIGRQMESITNKVQ